MRLTLPRVLLLPHFPEPNTRHFGDSRRYAVARIEGFFGFEDLARREPESVSSLLRDQIFSSAECQVCPAIPHRITSSVGLHANSLVYNLLHLDNLAPPCPPCSATAACRIGPTGAACAACYCDHACVKD